MIELQPLHVYFDPTKEDMWVNFTCLYKASDPLGEIAFFADELPVMSSSAAGTGNRIRDLAPSGSYLNANLLSERISLPKGTQYVHCKVYSLDGTAIGSMSSKVHYSKHGWFLPRGIRNFYTANGLPLSESRGQWRLCVLHAFVRSTSTLRAPLKRERDSISSLHWLRCPSLFGFLSFVDPCPHPSTYIFLNLHSQYPH